MSASLIDLALRRARRRQGPHPKGTRREALILWVAAARQVHLLRVPSMNKLADGVAALARLQAERGIRTIAGRSLTGGGGR